VNFYNYNILIIFTAYLSSAVPEYILMFSVKSSIPSIPTVNPEHIPANNVKTKNFICEIFVDKKFLISDEK